MTIDTTKLRELAQSFVTQGAPKWEVEWAANEIDRLLTIEAAARNLAKVKGRHHSELAMNQLLEALK